MKKCRLFLIFIITFLFIPTIYAQYELERQDIYDYKAFFEELYPNETNDDNCSLSTTGIVYAECSGVTVNGKTYPLEDYVAGVLYAEFATAIDNEEMGKAAAIIVRSYTLKHTNNCSQTIGSSSYEQNFVQANTGVVDLNTYKKYATETAGQVITDDDGIILAVYFAMTQGNCDKFVGNNCQKKLYYRYQSGGTHTISVPTAELPRGTLGSHDSGLAVWAAVYQAEKLGYTYDKILKEYYGNNIKISTLSGSSDSSDTNKEDKNKDKSDNQNNDNNQSDSSQNKKTKISVEKDSDNSCIIGSMENGEYVSVNGVSFPVKNYNIEGSAKGLGKYFDLTAGNVSQCPWYAKYRAIEIIMTSNLDKKQKEKAKAVLLATSGNGNDWYAGKNSTLSYFKYSKDVTKPKAGAIVSWERNTHNYGHVGIVEKVNDDGTVMISEGWNRFGAESSDNVSSIKIITTKYTIDEIRSYKGTGSFIGYTYLFSYKG